MMPSLVLIGYFPKKVVPRPDLLKAPHVRAIRSASTCTSPGPPNWVDHWTHNKMWLYSTVAAALAVVPEAERHGYELHAYRMLSRQWDHGVEEPFPIPHLEVEPLPRDFESIGFDPVSIYPDYVGFGCSPLSCNYMAREIPANEHCLLNTVELAMQTAMDFSRTEPEPGPYHVVEVLRRAGAA